MRLKLVMRDLGSRGGGQLLTEIASCAPRQLVVDVTNNNDQTWFDIVGDFHSDALHVAERFTPVDAETIEYEATITDPKVYTRPWKMALRIVRRKDYTPPELWEEACYENNAQSLEGDTDQTRTIGSLAPSR